MAYAKNQSLSKCFAILEALSAHPLGMTANEVAVFTGLPLSTAHRFLQNLNGLGYVRWDPNRKLYAIAFALTLFGDKRGIIGRINKRARPFLRELSVQSGLAVYLASLEGPHAIIEQKAVPEQVVKGTHAIGARIEAHAHSLGKALLALMPRVEFQRLYEAYPLRAYTRQTIPTHEQLTRELATVTAQGYATDFEEHSPGMSSIGCALLNPKGSAICAIAVEGSRHRMQPSQRAAVVAALHATRDKIMKPVRPHQLD